MRHAFTFYANDSRALRIVRPRREGVREMRAQRESLGSVTVKRTT
jgi:hypothetical protein